MDIKKITTLGQLKKSGYQPKSVKEEIRANLIVSIRNKENPFQGSWVMRTRLSLIRKGLC
jgi:magnesium chelatase subunit I